MDKQEPIIEIVAALQNAQIQLGTSINSLGQLKREICARVNYLIANDLTLLISILYRLDISEKKLKQLLQQTKDTTSGDIIAELIIERQLQKIESRKTFRNSAPDVPDVERW